MVGTAALVVALAGGIGAPHAAAQLLPPETTEPVPDTTQPPETTVPPETTAAPTTEAPTTTAATTTAPPATRAPTTTAPTTTAAPATTTTAPPDAPPTIPTTTVPVEGRARITQGTPDLGGVLTIWGLGIVATIATLAWSWQRNRRSAGGGP